MLELRIECEGRSWSVPLNAGARWRIGRGEECEIRVADRRISAVHAELTHSDGRWMVKRTGGQKPIEADGRAVDELPLASGISFGIGSTRFCLISKQDGMSVFDTQAVLSKSWSAGQPVEPAFALESTQGPTQPQPAKTPPSARLMAELSILLSSSRDRSSLAREVLDLACRRLTATRALLAKVEQTNQLRTIAAAGIPASADISTLVSTTVLKQILDERQAVLIGNTASASSGLGRQDSVVRNHIYAVACTPVFNTRGELAAILYADNQDRPAEFSPQDAELLIWLGQLYSVLDDNLEMRALLEKEVTELKQAAAGVQMVAEAPVMLALLDRVKRAAASEATVLILGESGTGKEFIARMLHRQSSRAGGPFVTRNCAAIPETLFESEMFGHRKGSFTGADRDRPGAFAEAGEGTIFLDEIGDLSPTLQTKLLRVLQEKVIRPVGSDTDLPMQARVICATNRDLREGFKTRDFREDLYYRIATVTLTVPPLRERREEILPLARHFVQLIGGGTRSMSPAAQERLSRYDWPGNVRELRSVVEQAVIFAGGEVIQAEELTLPETTGSRIHLGPLSLAEAERRHILQVLQSVQGNKTEAARLLGIARSTLVLKLHTYGK